MGCWKSIEDKKSKTQQCQVKLRRDRGLGMWAFRGADGPKGTHSKVGKGSVLGPRLVLLINNICCPPG